VLPPHPDTMTEAWKLSLLEYQYSQLEMARDKDVNLMNSILVEAAKIVGKVSINAEQLHGIYGRIIEIEAEVSIVQRVKGMFTFVNFMWLLAIAGVAISVGPFLYVILKPLRKMLIGTLKFIWERIIIPMHSMGVFELLSYIICILFVIEGIRFPPETGFYISLTGLVCVIPCFVYSTGLFSPYKPNQNTFVFGSLWICIIWVPMSIYYESYILSWLTVMTFYQCIGFSVICTGLCYYIGFEDDDGMIRATFTSIIILLIFTVLRVGGVTSSKIIQIYSAPFTTFGSIVLHLALLIISYRYFYPYSRNYSYNYREHPRFVYNYYVRQAYMIVTILLSLFFGNVYGIAGLRNTAYTFIGLYGYSKYAEMHFEKRWNGWVFVFIFSLALYQTALYLHSNPHFIVSLFDYE